MQILARSVEDCIKKFTEHHSLYCQVGLGRGGGPHCDLHEPGHGVPLRPRHLLQLRRDLARGRRGAAAGRAGPLPEEEDAGPRGVLQTRQPRDARGHPVAAADLLQPLHLREDHLADRLLPQPRPLHVLPCGLHRPPQVLVH